jgi:hypothetical protein
VTSGSTSRRCPDRARVRALASWGLVLWLALGAIGAGPTRARAQGRLPRGRDGWQSSGLGAIRGVTIGPIESSQQPGRGYGTPYTAALLDELVRMGVTWVSITPFGRIWSLQSTDITMDFEAPYEDNRAAIARFVEQAHARGIRVLLIPHLWVWSEVGWRGEIDPGTPEGWRDYQRSYHDFVLAWARDAAAAEIDAFSIGVECKSWSGRFGGFWAALIDDVRAAFPGWLTYSGNWDEVDDVIFWDRLDLIGINAFYPLAHHDGASFEEYLEGARQARDGVARLSEALDMPVLFVEIGYTTRRDAAVEPWLWPDGMSDVAYSEEEQARALEASLDAFLPEEWFAGFFVWRYYANLDDVSQEAIWGFSPHGKVGEPMLRALLSMPFGADPDPLSIPSLLARSQPSLAEQALARAPILALLSDTTID